MSWGAAAAVGLGAVGGLAQQKSTGNAQKKQAGSLDALQNEMLGVLEPSLAQGEDYIKQANKARVGGFDAAAKDAERITDRGVQNASEQGAAAQSAIRGASASRGLTGSSVQANQSMGAARATSRAMTDAEIAGSRLKSSALIGKGEAEASGLGALANFQAYKASSQNAVLDKMWGFIANKQFHAQQPNYAGIGALGQMLSGHGGGGGSPSAYGGDDGGN